MTRRRWGQALLAAVGLLNLVPGLGAISPTRAGAAYGVDITGPDLEVLMRHRALLLALVGGMAVTAVFRPSLRPAALVANALSLGGFVLITVTTAGLGTHLVRIAWIDAGALIVLSGSAILLDGRRT